MEAKTCKKCGAQIHWLEVFPGCVCMKCHEKQFDEQVRKNGGELPRPDFVGALTI